MFSREIVGSVVLVLGMVGVASRCPAQQLLLENGAVSAVVDDHGIESIHYQGTTIRMAQAHPLLISLTDLDNPHNQGRVSPTQAIEVLDFDGSELRGASYVTRRSASAASVAWTGTLPGVTGRLTAVYDFEVVDGPQGPGVVVRGRLQSSTLELGIRSLTYRHCLAASNTPNWIAGGLTGLMECEFSALAAGAIDGNHPFLTSGGVHDFRGGEKQYLTTRTSESFLISSARSPGATHDLMVTLDGRRDPEHTSRDLGIFGAETLQGERLFATGAVSYLPNDNCPANGGKSFEVGPGLYFSLLERRQQSDPYWDTVRAYRERWVDPFFDEGLLDERPEWMERCLYLGMNVSPNGEIHPEPVLGFLDRLLSARESDTDLALLLWGALDEERYAPLLGLKELLDRIDQLEQTHGVRIHRSAYFLPTAYVAGPSGGSRAKEIALDEFFEPSAWALTPSHFSFQVDTGGPSYARFLTGWLDLLPDRLDGIYLDDAYRGRQWHQAAYNPGLSVQGRLPDQVRGYLKTFGLINEHFVRRGKRDTYLWTELGVLSQLAPGNLVQGNSGAIEVPGPIFSDTERRVRFRPFLNDVAGHRWMMGFSGTVTNAFLMLEDGLEPVFYTFTDVVRGMAPAINPIATSGGFFGISEIAAAHGEPYLDAASGFADRSTTFFAENRDILTHWRREPLPGSTDIGLVQHRMAGHAGAFSGLAEAMPYDVPVEEIPYGVFSDGHGLAIAVCNPTLDAAGVAEDRVVGFSLERGRGDAALGGPVRVTVQSVNDALPRLLYAESAAGTAPIDLDVLVPGHDFLMIRIEPAVSSLAAVETTGSQSRLDGKILSNPLGAEWEFTLTDAPPLSEGALAVSLSGPVSSPFGEGAEQLIVLPEPLSLPFETDAQGRATIRTPALAVGELWVQALVPRQLSGPKVFGVSSSNAVRWTSQTADPVDTSGRER